MSKTAMIRARIEPKLKNRVEAVFKRLGLSATEAVTVFYKQVELKGGLPFNVVIPNDATVQTFENTDAGQEVIVCADAKDMFKKLGI